MEESKRLSIRDISEEEWEKLKKLAIRSTFFEPDPNAREYNPRFPLADQSSAAQRDFYYNLRCMRAEQEYFALMEKKKKRESVNAN